MRGAPKAIRSEIFKEKKRFLLQQFAGVVRLIVSLGGLLGCF